MATTKKKLKFHHVIEEKLCREICSAYSKNHLLQLKWQYLISFRYV